MDFRRLETFRAVARGGSLKQAANLLGRTISAISIQIRKLEEEIGAPLFHHAAPKALGGANAGRTIDRDAMMMPTRATLRLPPRASMPASNKRIRT